MFFFATSKKDDKTESGNATSPNPVGVKYLYPVANKITYVFLRQAKKMIKRNQVTQRHQTPKG